MDLQHLQGALSGGPHARARFRGAAPDEAIGLPRTFFLPAELPSSPSAQLGYWQSTSSYPQTMAFEAKGKDITFATRTAQNHVAWDAKGVVTAGVGHHFGVEVLWSTSATTGKVDVWFDGAQVVTDEAAQTRPDGNEVFTQLGLLRGAIDFADAPVIFIDDAVEGDFLADVRPVPASVDAGTDAGDVPPARGPPTRARTPLRPAPRPALRPAPHPPTAEDATRPERAWAPRRAASSRSPLGSWRGDADDARRTGSPTRARSRLSRA